MKKRAVCVNFNYLGDNTFNPFPVLTQNVKLSYHFEIYP